MEGAMIPDPLDVAEFEDAIGVLDELHMVISRLKRLRLVDDSEHHEAKQFLERIAGILNRKIG